MQDNEAEALRNTLSSRVRNAAWDRPCYWSSSGSASPDAQDEVTYRLAAPLCFVHAVQLRPFRAYFQLGFPIYSPLRVRVLLGALDEDAGGYGGSDAAGHSPGWRYTSPYFDVRQADELQTLTLPQPALCVGGVVCLQLCGRAQTQESDGRWYVCLVHVRVLGTVCYGITALPGQPPRLLVFDDTDPMGHQANAAAVARLELTDNEADASSEEDDDEADDALLGPW